MLAVSLLLETPIFESSFFLTYLTSGLLTYLISGDIIILHMCSKNHNHIMFSSWDTEWDKQNFLSLWAIFCSFTPLPWPIFCPFTLPPKYPEKQNFVKWKRTWRYHLSFYKCVPQMTVIWYMVPEIWSAKDRIFFHQKIKKTPGDIIILHKWQSWYMVPKIMECGQNFL